MEKASKSALRMCTIYVVLMTLAAAAFTMGCQRTLSSQEAPVITKQATVGQPYNFMIQFMTPQSQNARPIHAQAAGVTREVMPGPLGRNWAEYANFAGANISLTISVNGQADTATTSEGTPTTGPVDQSPTQENKAAIPVAFGPNSRASASVADEAAGDTTTGDDTPEPTPEPAPEPEPTPEPTPASDPVSLHTLEDMMLAQLKLIRIR